MPQKVVVIGGGVAGMSAAHELIERGFQVEIYDRNPHYVGGKARSIAVPGTSTNGQNNNLPGEHGFRFFPGFYKHVTDTMRRIPYGTKGKTCFDNLVSTETVEICQTGQQPILLPMNLPSSALEWLKAIEDFFESFIDESKDLTKPEVQFFVDRVWQLMTSCDERFLNEYEQIGWWEYLRADDFSDAYRALLVEGLTRSLVAAKAQTASTRTVGTIFLQLIYGLFNTVSKDTDRVLNGPTTMVWLRPWLQYLESKGAVYHHGHEAVEILMNGDLVAGINFSSVEGSGAVQKVTGDYYLLSVPVEVAATLINKDVLKADASLQNIITLAPNVEWMNGIQFYLNKRFDMHRGHTIYSNSAWALTSISQIQFWPGYKINEKYDGTVRGILSVDISDWYTPGNFNGKAARDCTVEEVKTEVWEQLKQEINVGPIPILTDDMKRFVYLDSDIYYNPDGTPDLTDNKYLLGNREPLLVNQVNTWTLRSNSYTGIPNLFLASDYVKTYTDLATMEGANEAARRAVNNILEVSGSSAPKCELWPLESPRILDFLKGLDKNKYDQGLAWQNVL
jgi:uncharacterized protein with NAD-binding domain and iron-sulfur cluster